jgi:hypothetical protein
MSSLEEKGQIPRPDEHKICIKSCRVSKLCWKLLTYSNKNLATSFTTHHMLLKKVVAHLLAFFDIRTSEEYL